MDNLIREIEKLRFQIKLMAAHLDLEDDPTLRLALRLNWDEENFDAADEIFEENSNLLKTDKESTLPEFEKKLKERLDVSLSRGEGDCSCLLRFG